MSAAENMKIRGVMKSELTEGSAAEQSRGALFYVGDMPYKAKEGDPLILTKYAALGGTVRLAKLREEELSGIFSVQMMTFLGFLGDKVDCGPETAVLDRLGAREGAAAGMKGLICPCGEGGLYKALWSLTKEMGRGFVIHTEDIPLLQETIEICNYYDIDPMRLDASGSLLMTVPAAMEDMVLAAMEEAEIPAFIFGRVTKALAKRLETDEQVRFLDRPAPDEIEKVLGKAAPGGAAKE